MLRNFLLTAIVLAFYVSGTYSQQAPPFSANPRFSVDVQTGYTNYLGINVAGTIANFSYEVPLAIRFGLGYNLRNAGQPWDARKIFINDNTTGDPEKSAYNFDFRIDFAYPINLFPVRKTYLYAGPRLSMYTASFEFIGGNEFFDIKTTQFGIGAGLETHLGISQNLSFVVSGGFDYFFDSEIGGHDTFYSPDGTDINGRLDYTYADADDAISQPKYELRFMVGLNLGL